MRRKIYICHPFSGDVRGNVAKVKRIARQAFLDGLLPIAPHLYLPSFIDEATERKGAMDCCIELIRGCDEVWCFGPKLTKGMKKELQWAHIFSRPIARKVAP